MSGQGLLRRCISAPWTIIANMWSAWLRVLSAPTLLIFSLPLAMLAVATTICAFWIFTFCLIGVYADMLLTIVRAWFLPRPLPEPVVDKISAATDTNGHIKYSRTNSVASDMSTTGQPPRKSDSYTRLGASLSERDFEGVGGWRFQGDDEEEALWTGINNRLQFPSRRHRFSFSLGESQMSSAIPSPVLSRTPMRSRTPGRSHAPGTASPEGYFSVPLSMSCTSSLLALSAAEKHARSSLDEQRAKLGSRDSAISSTSSSARDTVNRVF